MSKFLFVLSALLFGIVGGFGAPVTFLASAETESLGECVMEVSSRRILFEHDPDRRLPEASTTKILTAIIIIEDCDLKENVVIPRAAQGVEGSSVYLLAGENYTVEELLYGLMLRSGNDCAVALALHHSGSIEAFAAVMNRRAALMGATNSKFCNPHGLEDEEHRTTARDLALIASYAMQNQTFQKIVSTQYFAPRGYHNKNKMLSRFEGAVGVKTGFTKTSGRCLVTGATREGMTLVCVVLNSPQMYERSEELLENAFKSYHIHMLLNAEEGFEGFSLRESFSYPLKEEEVPKIVFEKELLSPQPEGSGEYAGVVKILLENRLIFSENLYIM